MAAPTLAQVVEGIETVMETVLSRSTAFTPDQVNPPAGWVRLPPINYRATFGARRWTLRPQIIVVVSPALDRLREQKLAEYADHTGSKSLFQAFGGHASGTTLGGVVDQCFITEFEPLAEIVIGQVAYFGGQFQLEVIATGV